MKTKLFTLLFALLATIGIVNAGKVNIGGLYYDLDDVNKTATVAQHNQCAGAIVIPSSVISNGTEYTVTSVGAYAFADCTGMVSITIPNTITSIGEQAFSICTGLTSITIPNSVTNIAQGAFYKCSSLSSIDIPNGVAEINFGVFSGCTSLTSVTLPNSITGIDDDAFKDCASLTSITIPRSVTRIDSEVFRGCSSLSSIVWNAKNCNTSSYVGYEPFYSVESQITSFTFGEEVETIPNAVCRGMSSLKSIIIPNSVTSMGEYAFAGCNGLTTVSLSSNITSISNYAFSGCRNLSAIEIPNSVTSVGAYAFENCKSMVSVSIPQSVLTIGACAFYNCSSIASVNIFNLEAWCNIQFNSNTPSNPLYYGADLYLNGTLLTNLVIPSSVTNIANNLFQNCKSITSLTLTDNVTSIGKSAFSGCSNLSSIVISDGITSVGEQAFSDCTSATSITIGTSVKTFGKQVFSGCAGVTSVVWNAKNCTSENAPFYNTIASQITSFTFGEEVETIPNAVCRGMSSLKSIIIPNSVTSIGTYAFCACSVLNSITFSKNIKSIGKYAFSYCRGVTYLNFPNILESIDIYAFENCNSLTHVYFPNSLKSIGNYAFRNCSNLQEITFSEGLQSIGEYAFYNCSYLYDLNFPNSLTTIGAHAFENCTWLNSVTIGEGVTSVGDDAFYKCNNIQSLTWNAINCSNVRYFYVNGVAHPPFPSTVTSVIFGDKVQRIPGGVCGGMENLTSITIPNGVKSIGYAFTNCSRLTAVYISDITAWCNISFDDVPFSYSHNLYLNGKIVTDLIIPSGVKSIGKGAFANCARISSVVIPKSVTSIADYAFNPCAAVDTFYVKSNTPASLGSEVFATTAKIKVNCSAQETYWNNTQWNLYNILNECTNDKQTYYTIRFLNWDGTVLQNVQVEDGDMPAYTGATPTRPEDNTYTYTFNGWSPTITVATTDADYTALFTAKKKSGEWESCGDNLLWKLDNKVLTIKGTGDMWNYDPREDGYANYAPWGIGITSVYIEEGVTSIGNNAFCSNTNLVSAQLPNSLKKIGEGAFWDCMGLTTIDIPAAVNNIDNDALGACYSLVSINVANDNANYCSIDGVLYNKAKTTLLQYPFGKTTTTFTIPNGVTRIGQSAFCYFYNSNVSIVIPESVTSIGQFAFYDASLQSITCKAETPPTLDTYVFEGNVYSAILYVPEQSINTYKSKTGWKSFRTIKAIPVATGMEETYSNMHSNTKTILHNGQIFILKGEKVFTIMGQEVR